MKILHLNTFEQIGGAAKSAYRLHRALLNAGVDSRMLVKQRDSQDLEVSVAESEVNLDAELDLVQRFYIDQHKRADAAPFTHSLAATSVASHPWVEEADIIHLHWVSRLLQTEDFRQFRIKGKRVVWTLHDQWPLTGGCHYSGGCTAFEAECFDCPVLERDPFHFVNWSFKVKSSTFQEAVDAVICPSQWMEQMARNSATFRNTPRFVVPYCLDLDTFRPESKQAARARLLLPQDSILILYSAYASRAPRKGLQNLLNAFDCIARKGQAPQIHVLLAGAGSENIQLSSFPSTAFGLVNDPDRLSRIYSAADFSVHPTLQDNLPNAIIESLSCGTPAIAFRTGGVPDLVKDGVTGFLVDAGEVQALGERILALAADRPLMERLSQNSREFAEAKFQPAKVAQAYLELYTQVLQLNRASSTPAKSPPASFVPLRVLGASFQDYWTLRLNDVTAVSQARAKLIDHCFAKATNLIQAFLPDSENICKQFADVAESKGDEGAKLDAQAETIDTIFRSLQLWCQESADLGKSLQKQVEELQSRLVYLEKQVLEQGRYIDHLKVSSKYERPIRDFLWRVMHSSHGR